MKSKYFQSFIMEFNILRVISENEYLKKNSTLQQGTHKIGL